ncbi:hypothetical protein EDD85DRAFT_745507, partial [Armillaria nabsnona]
LNAFVSILEVESASIERTTRESHQYGPTDSDCHTLDYYPPSMRPDALILIFSYGGGFYITHLNSSIYFCSTWVSAPAFIIYHNPGPFAARVFITVVFAYHLVDSGVQFPGTAQDVRDAMQWVVNNLPFSDSDIYILGHSVGPTNVFTILALPEL